MVMLKHFKRFVRRWLERKRAKEARLAYLAASCIQAVARLRLVAKWFPEFKKQRLKEFAATIKIQSIARMFLARRFKAEKSGRELGAVICIQSMWRGFRARLHTMMEREALEKTWNWLGTDRPRTAFSHLLPKEYYGQPIMTNGPLGFWMDRELVRLQDLKAGMQLGPPGTASGSRSGPRAKKKSSKATDGGAKADNGQATPQTEEEEEEEKPLNKELWSKIPFLAYDDIGTGKIRRRA
jgi:hypothetical protein